MIEIDGNAFEGGGQILRTALALSTLTKMPFEIADIRKNRPLPGLKNQHLYCIKALKELSDAKVENAEIGSTKIRFFPSDIKAKTLNIDIKTAGSITLLLQSIIIPSIFANKNIRLKIIGGTDVKWSSPVDYFSNVFLPQISKYTKSSKFVLKNRGYYPKGSGDIDLIIHPKYKLKDFENFDTFLEHIRKEGQQIDLNEQGKLIKIKGTSHASKELSRVEVAERQAERSKLILSSLNCPISILTEYRNTPSTGSGITLWATFSMDEEEINFDNPTLLGADSLGEKEKKAEIVGEEVANKLLELIKKGAPVDPYLADQLIPFIALFGGKIKTSKITQHALANAYVCEKFLGKTIEIDEENKVIKSTF